MNVIYGKHLVDPNEEFHKDFINKEEYHQITMDEYSLRKNISDAFNNISTVISEAFDRIDKGLKALAEKCGMSCDEVCTSLEVMLSKVQEYKELSVPKSKYIKPYKFPEYSSNINLTSVVIPKKKFHKARGRLKC